ncbi:hypothetical protein LTR27_001193 [Elasticomyces elasticus]|nr:hypothetical protein LTR27_001193 [Elasticomyces elasticus]
MFPDADTFLILDVSEIFRQEGRFQLDAGELAAEDADQTSDLEYNPNKHRKRKRGTADKTSTRKQHHCGSDDDCGIGSRGWRARLDEDQDDEEVLPVKTEACESDNGRREDGHAAESLGRLSLEPKVESLSRAVTPVLELHPAPQVAPGTPEEENLYTDSRHPSLYRELNSAQSGIVVQRASQPLAMQTLRHSSAEDGGGVDDDADAGGQAPSQQQGNMPGHIDLTMADAEEGLQVKQEADDTANDVVTASLASVIENGSEDEEDLEIRAEELRLQREDVRIQREQLEVRRRQHAIQKKKREGN